MPEPRITVFLADDNLIVREGVRALIGSAPDMEVVGVAGDYDGLVTGAEQAAPQVVVTDIRMPPTFQREGIEAAKQVRKRHPGTGIVVLSQYDEPGMHERRHARRDGLSHRDRHPELLVVRAELRVTGPHVRAERIVEPARALVPSVGVVGVVHRAQ